MVDGYSDMRPEIDGCNRLGSEDDVETAAFLDTFF